MSNLKFKAPVDIYVNGEYERTTNRIVIHRLAIPYARYEKQWYELEAIMTNDGSIHFSIFIERTKDHAAT